MSEIKKQRYGNWILIAVALLLFGTAIATTQFKVPVIMANLMEQFSMDPDGASWLMSIFTFVGIVLALPTGMLAKQFGPKNMLVAAAAIMAVGSLIGAFSTSSLMLIISRGIEGVAFIFVTICGPLAVQKYAAPDKIGSATGIWALWVCLGSVVGGTLTPSLFSATGFMGVWIIYAIAVVVFIVGVIVFVKLPDGEASAASEVDIAGIEAEAEAGVEAGAGAGEIRAAHAAEKVSYATFFKPNTLLFFFTFLAFNMVLMAVLSFSPTWMQLQGIDPTVSGFISTLPMLLAVIASPTFGSLADRLGRCKPLYIIGMLAMGPCAFLMLTGSDAMLWVGAVLMGLLGLGVPVMCLTSFNGVLAEPKLASVGMGVLMLVQSLGQFLGTFISPMLLGPASDQWMTLGIAMLIIGLIGTLSIVVCKFK
ncbi:MFS transporter [Adlercreutzia sp. ZJ304]|uniref:MFS transporter n=1 Tax=Adlercreutzia sp. ZJ304 TaxID=2709791 RepID=UPI0013EA87F5|nr:MFS transporter [Adlercreutzia sp. ZJ304]